ncbi:MAG: protein archease [Ardenticatenia bacterium]|nr:MAG: protein archease [Ardenticatenia bacterium]
MGGMLKGFEEVEHTADIALRVRGRDLRELLVNAALGLGTLLTDHVDMPAEAVQTRPVEVDAFDPESLLVGWLSELIYWAEKDRFVCRAVEMQEISSTHLKAICIGSCVPELRHHIKAVTYHNLQIVQTDQGLETTVVFDV